MKNLDQELNVTHKAWGKISPTWPLQNIIACNPLQGFEDLEFADALKQGARFFQNKDMPAPLEKINQLTIKWCQVFFDEGQATITMPNRQLGFYQSWKKLAIFDDHLHHDITENINFLHHLPDTSHEAITHILTQLNVDKKDQEEFLTAILTTLSGWSSYVRYLGQWSYQKNAAIESDYLAIRLAITALTWPNAAKELFHFMKNVTVTHKLTQTLKNIKQNEKDHHRQLLSQINQHKHHLASQQTVYDAQLVFCIDVRSEPMRKAIESCGNYETFGFAGFFGIPTAIANDLNEESYASCPVLLEPKHTVTQKPFCDHTHHKKHIKGYSTISEIKKFYQSLKYNFTTPLPLAEGMGIWSGGWMFIKTFSPKGRKLLQNKLRKSLKQDLSYDMEITSIPFADQCSYGAGALKAMGLVDNFAKTIIFCGHGSQTENNTYATALDCGACGGRHGDSNAKILAKILNQDEIRNHLQKEGIFIPHDTRFYGGKHNTTTDEVEIYQEEIYNHDLEQLKIDLRQAQTINNANRAQTMGAKASDNQLSEFFFQRAHSWSETQPEWGLAKNASFIVAPRALTQHINLGARSFLHSYDWRVDEDDSILHLILNAPMIVAQWINSQYLFSTIDNIAFGSGSKITQNIVGKMGVMQGNGSDLMHGLSLQSVYSNDDQPYHQGARLSTVIYAPKDKIQKVVQQSPKVAQLISNHWITIHCLDPDDLKIYQLQDNVTWLLKHK